MSFKTNLKKLTVIPAVLMLFLTACGTGSEAYPTEADSAPLGVAPTADNSFIITLYPKIAPITCENFESLVRSGFYDGVTFHRVIDDFMAQGGDPEGTGMGGSGKNIKGEFAANGVTNNLSHTRGVVSMARGSYSMDSASSQFFICYSDRDTFLDGKYAAFGKVTEGMEVVDSFLEVERVVEGDSQPSRPVQPIVMDNLTMITADSDGNPRVQVVMRDIPKQKK